MNIHENARLTVQGRSLLVQRVRQHSWTVEAAVHRAWYDDLAHRGVSTR